jgi:hypothetical protein
MTAGLFLKPVLTQLPGTLGVPTSGAAARQEPFDRYACVKNEALSGHVALREFPLDT